MLKEISIMRPILVLLVVVYHAFIVYGGGWKSPACFIEIPLYEQITWWSYSFMLEAFTFISGFIYIYTSKHKGMDSFKNLVIKKSKRLLLPLVLFGTLYFVCFMEYISLESSVYTVLNGAGHLWYLIMLFWCFLEAWLLLKIKMDERIKLCCVALLAIFGSWMPLPFYLSKSLYYLFFFYLPVFIVENRDSLYEKLKEKPLASVLTSWGLFILTFIIIKYFAHHPYSLEGLDMIGKSKMLIVNTTLQMFYSFLGTIAFYLTALLIAGTTQPVSKNSLMIKIGGFCFGIYVFQQFILQGIYYNTALPEILGPFVLPWVGALMALGCSLLLTYLTRLTPIGRQII